MTLSDKTETVGYWTEHVGNTGGSPEGWQATCTSCDWHGTQNPRTQEGWDATAAELDAHRQASREWVAVEAGGEEPWVVYVVQDENYDFSGLREIYRSLHAALADNPYPWRCSPDDPTSWVREDGDAIQQTAMSLVRVEVQP